MSNNIYLPYIRNEDLKGAEAKSKAISPNLREFRILKDCHKLQKVTFMLLFLSIGNQNQAVNLSTRQVSI